MVRAFNDLCHPPHNGPQSITGFICCSFSQEHWSHHIHSVSRASGMRNGRLRIPGNG